MNTNRDVILVDLSNIRDQTGEKVRTARGLVPAFSRSYLDGFEDSLRTLAPYAHIVFIAGRAIVSKDLWIEGGKRQSTDFKWMKHRTKSKGESDFVYLMQEQMDGEEHIKADELILHLAHQLNGFVISNDNYNDFNYREMLREVGHKHFGPKYDHPSDSWFFELKLHDQVDLLKRPAGFLLEECLTSSSTLEQEEEDEFRQYLYDFAIPDFWSERGQYTVDSKKGITQKVSEILEFAKIINVRQSQNSVLTASILGGLSAFGIPHLRRERMSNKFVELFGRTKTYVDQIFLEGIPGDKAVLLEGFDEMLNPNTGFLQITGKLRFEDNQAILEHRGSSVVVEIDMKQALKIVGTPRVSSRNRENYVRWVMKPLPWEHRKTITSPEKKIIGDPLIRVMMESEKITTGPNVEDKSGKNPVREEQVGELLDQTGPERGSWEFDSRSKLVIVVALTVILVVAGMWLRGASVDNGCQGSNPCIGGSTSSVPVLEPAPTKWIWRSAEKIWVRE